MPDTIELCMKPAPRVNQRGGYRAMAITISLDPQLVYRMERHGRKFHKSGIVARTAAVSKIYCFEVAPAAAMVGVMLTL